ncbi:MULTISPECIES: type I secretion protein [unclassified Ruegeria]|uniref:type I secretion protein n=1 Tax=unclassified Ruegeria TaxID=2625375 RepID=UPI001ADBDFA7|nr:MULTISPECIES: type I secretion protein [unclassified Ruegeria]MBO9410162.1 type I secretion protein [Ruegeria sp. R8_1]MBO9414619.1 type I secretion protein [Ruegeria sp. R8_2]
MSFDSISETIAHFIGTFDLTTEQARLRDQYQEFTALRRKAEMEELEEGAAVKVRADLNLDPGKYDALPYAPSVSHTDIPLAPNPQPLGPIPDGPLQTGPGPDQVLPDAAIASTSIPILVAKPILIPELIGSAVTYAIQTLDLNDNDTIGQGDFRDVDSLVQQGQELADVALSLHAVSSPSFSISDYQSIEHLESIVAEIQAPFEAPSEDVTVHQFQGEEAMGTIVNGEHVEELPDFLELVPSHHLPDEEDDSDHPDLLPTEWDQSDDADFGDGHTVIAGGNLAINEVAITVGWVDAPVIAVGGQSVNLTVVSQVAIVSDVDEGPEDTQSETTVVQSSSIAVESNEASWLDDNVSEEGQDPLVAITWISGDLFVTNFVKQEINATDIDHIETQIDATTSLFVLGDNDLVNEVSVVELGSYYDLVLIGGDMVSVDFVHQTIALVDDDVVSGVVAEEDNDNLVMNHVELTTFGEDTHEELSETLAEVLPLQEMDTDALEDALLNDPQYAGMEQVRVLKIEGDLVQVNVVEQVTTLQDQDDIHVQGGNGAIASALGAGNAVLNAASISTIGVDSVVMASEGEYSDVVLHQASLIDTPDEDLGAELANEAIAILMQETSGPGKSDLAPGHNKLTPSEMASVDDALSSMLA